MENINASKDSKESGQHIIEGYKPSVIIKGYQPEISTLNNAKPPQGGSGLPPKSTSADKK